MAKDDTCHPARLEVQTSCAAPQVKRRSTPRFTAQAALFERNIRVVYRYVWIGGIFDGYGDVADVGGGWGIGGVWRFVVV